MIPSVKVIGNPRGASGRDAFVYIAYASDDSGSDFSLTPASSSSYIAVLTTTTEIETPQASDFTGLWKKFTGTDYKGLYDAGTQYYVGNLVYYGGSTYICTDSSLGNLPTDTDYWDVFAIAGGNNVFYPDEVPTGLINGVNTSYTLTETPLYLMLFLNGQRLTDGNDYTLSGGTITMTTAPETGDVLLASYFVGGTGTSNADTVDGYHASQLAKQTTFETEHNADGTHNLSAISDVQIVDLLRGDGWNTADAMTYVSATSFSVTGDKTVKYSKGTKIKLTNASTVKYLYVVSSSYSAGTGLTTVTTTGGSNYSLASGAITSPFYSYAINPQGFPVVHNFNAQAFDTGTIDNGSGGQPAIDKAFFRIVGGRVFISILLGTAYKVGTGAEIRGAFNSGVYAPVNTSYHSSYDRYGDCQLNNSSHKFMQIEGRNSTTYFTVFTVDGSTIPDNTALSSTHIRMDYQF